MTKWRSGDEIGSGGFGIVRECIGDDRPGSYAIKELVPGADDDARRRFVREVRLQSALSHRNVVPVIAMNLDIAEPFFVMPRAECPLVNYLVMDHGEHLIWMISDACRGVAEAHANGIVHRDIKPSNILVFDTPSGKFTAVSDFGLGRAVDSESVRMTASSVAMGTYAYVAPEQLRDAHRADARSDVFSLGIVILEVLTGDIPLNSVVDYDAIPERYRHIIWKACNADPSRRHASAGELLSDLEAAQVAPQEQLRPVDRLQALLNQVPPFGPADTETVDAIAGLLLEGIDDTEVVMKVAPRMPYDVILDLQARHPDALASLAEKYLQLTNGPMPFDYCDVIANFCRRLYRAGVGFSLRATILERLAWLGCYHNRWHVGDVLAELVRDTQDMALVRVLAEYLSNDSLAREWNASYLRKHSLPPVLTEVLDHA